MAVGPAAPGAVRPGTVTLGGATPGTVTLGGVTLGTVTGGLTGGDGGSFGASLTGGVVGVGTGDPAVGGGVDATGGGSWPPVAGAFGVLAVGRPGSGALGAMWTIPRLW